MLLSSYTTPARPFIGNRLTVELLTRLVARERLPTALLLTGAPHVGKGTLLRRLIATVLGVEGSRRIEHHLDLLRIAHAPETSMREVLVRLLHHTRQPPLDSPYRVVLLEGLDRLSSPAASLLLKSVEDAPPFTRFFLAADLRDKVPSTLRSRALLRELLPVGDQEVEDGLAAQGVNTDRARECALLAGGRPGLALELAADEQTLLKYRNWAGLVAGRASRREANQELPSDLARPEVAEDFLVFLLSCLRRGRPQLTAVRRTREALLLLRQYVPPPLVVEYALAYPS